MREEKNEKEEGLVRGMEEVEGTSRGKEGKRGTRMLLSGDGHEAEHAGGKV